MFTLRPRRENTMRSCHSTCEQAGKQCESCGCLGHGQHQRSFFSQACFGVSAEPTVDGRGRGDKEELGRQNYRCERPQQ